MSRMYLVPVRLSGALLSNYGIQGHFTDIASIVAAL